MNWITEPIEGYDILSGVFGQDCPVTWNDCDCSSGLNVCSCTSGLTK